MSIRMRRALTGYRGGTNSSTAHSNTRTGSIFFDEQQLLVGCWDALPELVKAVSCQLGVASQAPYECRYYAVRFRGRLCSLTLPTITNTRTAGLRKESR